MCTSLAQRPWTDRKALKITHSGTVVACEATVHLVLRSTMLADLQEQGVLATAKVPGALDSCPACGKSAALQHAHSRQMRSWQHAECRQAALALTSSSTMRASWRCLRLW